MSLFIKVDVNFQLDPKIMAVGPEAELMFLRGLAWSKSRQTDGEVPMSALPLLALGLRDEPLEIAGRLVIHGIWQATDDGYRVPFEKWSKWQVTKVQVDEISRKRSDAGRKGNEVRWGNEGPNPQVRESESQLATDLRRKGDRKTSPDLQTFRPSDLKPDVQPSGSNGCAETFGDGFAECWERYPRKEARKDALKAYQARRREGVSHSDLLNATHVYDTVCKQERREKRHILLAKTFFGPNERWMDYREMPTYEDRSAEVIER